MRAIKFLKQTNLYSLKFKMIIIIFLSFTFIITFSIFNSAIASHIIKEKTNTSVLRSVEQTNRYLHFLFKKARDIGYSISVNQNLQKLAKKDNLLDNGYYGFYTTIQDLYKDIMYQSQINGEIDSIFVYVDNVEYLVTSEYGMYTYKNMKDTLWADIVFEMKDNYEWINRYNDEEFNKTTCNYMLTLIIRADRISKNVETPVYVTVHFRESQICKIIDNIKITPNTLVYLIGDNNKILVSLDRSIIAMPFDEAIGIDVSVIDKKISRIQLNKDMYQAVFERNEIINGGLLVLIPEKELLAEQRIVRLFIIITVTIIMFFFIFFIIKIVIQYVDKPISKLTTYMKKAESGDFESQIEEIRKDEFGYLYTSYNQMVGRIKKLIQELYEQKLLRTEMEIKALQKQINPHFLYNTLETVNWIAKVNNVDRISKIVISLSNMYRITFNEGEDLIKIRDMIYGIQCYLDIQKVRFGENFSYEINISPEIYDYLMLNLILQTIVENAVIHGIIEGSEDGLIKIEGYSEKGDVFFIVEDNGKGMSEEKLQLVIANTKTPNIVSNSGLRNVQRRIQLSYGSSYGVSIESFLNKGTRVSLKVPIIKELNQRDLGISNENENRGENLI